MSSTFGGFEIAKRGLNVHQTAIQTTGHNIANADNENYSRQRVNLESMDPLYAPALNRANVKGQQGQGVQIASIERAYQEVLICDGDIHVWKISRGMAPVCAS